MKKDSYHSFSTALKAGAAAFLLAAAPLGTIRATATDQPVLSATTTAISPSGEWKAYDFSPLYTIKGVTYKDQPGLDAQITKDFSVRSNRSLTLTATSRKARRHARKMHADIAKNGQYTYISSNRKGDDCVYIYAHKNGGRYNEVLIFKFIGKQASILQIEGMFSSFDLTKISVQLELKA